MTDGWPTGVGGDSRLGGQKVLSSAGTKKPRSTVRIATSAAGMARAPAGGGARAIIPKSCGAQEGRPSVLTSSGGPQPASHIARSAISLAGKTSNFAGLAGSASRI